MSSASKISRRTPRAARHVKSSLAEDDTKRNSNECGEYDSTAKHSVPPASNYEYFVMNLFQKL